MLHPLVGVFSTSVIRPTISFTKMAFNWLLHVSWIEALISHQLTYPKHNWQSLRVYLSFLQLSIHSGLIMSSWQCDKFVWISQTRREFSHFALQLSEKVRAKCVNYLILKTRIEWHFIFFSRKNEIWKMNHTECVFLFLKSWKIKLNKH